MGWTSHAKHRNSAWSIWMDDQGKFDRDMVTRSILLDIREELRALNQVFSCFNFQRIPRVLDTIEQNTNRPRQRRLAAQRARAKARRAA